jgi:hypothetical protein
MIALKLVATIAVNKIPAMILFADFSFFNLKETLGSLLKKVSRMKKLD